MRLRYFTNLLTSRQLSTAPRSPPTNSSFDKKWSLLKKQLHDALNEPTPLIGKLQILGGVSTLGAYCASEPLLMRVLFGIGTLTGGIIPNAARKPKLILPIIWSCVFLAINSARIVDLLLERKPVSFSDEEMAIYEESFYRHFTPVQFKRLLTCGEKTIYSKGDVIKEEDRQALNMLYFVSGRASVSSLGNEVGTLEKGNFASIPYALAKESKKRKEKSMAESEDQLLRITAIDNVEIIKFNIPALQKLLAKDIVLEAGMYKLTHERLLNKILNRDKRFALQRYFEMVKVLTSETEASGVEMSGEDKRALRIFAAEHLITEDEKIAAVVSCGWTQADFAHGIREHEHEGTHTRSALEILLAKTAHVPAMHAKKSEIILPPPSHPLVVVNTPPATPTSSALSNLLQRKESRHAGRRRRARENSVSLTVGATPRNRRESIFTNTSSDLASKMLASKKKKKSTESVVNEILQRHGRENNLRPQAAVNLMSLFDDPKTKT